MQAGDEQSTKNQQIIDTLRSHGDALTQVREIDHWAYFPTGFLRAQFVVKCDSAGFDLVSTSDPQAPGQQYGARVSHRDVPGEEVMARIVGLLCDLAEECGGEYDGWETQIVR